ncbi:hypothetical protein [Curtobacterium sp. MCBA15_001]|uniref:hypothetical protein n=1 Tax=Curtobacterium sp. MCBA15_001 TaxID=1898731 RepID=UPI00111414BE|nr:hypothetical protein [Curtobacterium sp. MCBA15_001]
MTEQPESLVDQINQDPAGRAELALATYELRVEELFQALFEDATDRKISEVATALGAPAERLSALIEDSSQVNSQAFVRYASVCGYRPVLNLVPISEVDAPLPIAYMDFDASRVDIYRQRVVSQSGVFDVRWNRLAPIDEFVALEDMQHELTLNSTNGTVRRDHIESSDDLWELEWSDEGNVFSN